MIIYRRCAICNEHFDDGDWHRRHETDTDTMHESCCVFAGPCDRMEAHHIPERATK